VCTTPPRAGLTARSPTLSRHTTRQSMAERPVLPVRAALQACGMCQQACNTRRYRTVRD
jgi:hypothetical protein